MTQNNLLRCPPTDVLVYRCPCCNSLFEGGCWRCDGLGVIRVRYRGTIELPELETLYLEWRKVMSETPIYQTPTQKSRTKIALVVLAIILIGLVLLTRSGAANAGPLDKDMRLTWVVDLKCGTTPYPDSARSPEIARWGLDGSTTVLGTQAAATKADRAMLISSPLMEYSKRYWVEMYVNLAPGTPGCGEMSAPSAKVYKTMPAQPEVPPNAPVVTLAKAWREKDMGFYTVLVRDRSVRLPIGEVCGDKLPGRAGRKDFYYFGTDGLVAKCLGGSRS